MNNDLPLSPWVYELGNSLISSLAVIVAVILLRFFIIEIRENGLGPAYARMRFQLAAAIFAIVFGEAAYRSWTWWGRLCANADKEATCQWMLSAVWPLVPITSIGIEVGGMLCLIRILIPNVWGSRAWIISAIAATAWSLFWFSGWHELIAMFR